MLLLVARACDLTGSRGRPETRASSSIFNSPSIHHHNPYFRLHRLEHLGRNMAGKTRPIEKFAAATAKCTTQGAVYGKCVAANYQTVSKDMCAKEFMALKDCYLVGSEIVI